MSSTKLVVLIYVYCLQQEPTKAFPTRTSTKWTRERSCPSSRSCLRTSRAQGITRWKWGAAQVQWDDLTTRVGLRPDSMRQDLVRTCRSVATSSSISKENSDDVIGIFCQKKLNKFVIKKPYNLINILFFHSFASIPLSTIKDLW
jgi:hypothetical protein